MSLVVWLPLTKDLRNQGLANIGVTNNGATYSASGGKLGGCYNFDGSDDRIAISGLSLPNTWSYGCWFYSETSSRGWEGVITLNSSGGDTDNQMGFYTYPTEKRIQNTANGQWNSAITYVTGQWNHFFGTFDGANLKTYINGILVNTKTITNSLLSRSNLTIGGRSSSTTGGNTSIILPFQGKINDVRIYDHCLSPMEVKELSKGLVLHYPLNRGGWGQENFYTGNGIGPCGTGISSYTNNGYAHHSVWSNGGTARAQNLGFNGKTGPWTVSFDIKSSVNATLTVDVCDKGYSTATYGTNLVKNTWMHKSFIITTPTNQYNTSSAYNGFVDFNYSTAGTLDIKNLKVEEGTIETPWCPASSSALGQSMGLNSNIEYDTSGFNNNGTKVGTLTYTSDTPKYEVSTIFPENPANYIVTTGLKQQVFTWACWFKVLGAAEKSYQFILSEGRDMGSVGTNICTTKAGTGLYLDSHGIRSSTATISLNKWYHIALVCGDSQMSFYLNGQLIESKAYTDETDYAQSNNAFVIGKMAHAYTNTTVYFPFNGQISDVRIYATALSASDVLSLYQNSAYIDSNGNVYGAVHSEV